MTIGARTRRTATDGIATRKRYGSQITEVVPTINFRYALQDFNLLNANLLQPLEGNLSKFTMRYFDGQERGEVYNIACDTVEVRAEHGREISVDVAGIGENMSKGLPAITWQTDITTPPSTWRQTTYLNVSGTSGIDLISHFRDWSFRVSNNATPDVTGNVLTPAQVNWGKADYSGRIEIAKSITSLADELMNASKVSIQIGFKTRDASPIERCFNFLNVDLRQAEVRLPMDLVVHRIEWESNNLSVGIIT